MRLVFEDQTFSFELLRTIGDAPYGGADIGECLVTASHIREGDFESWHEQWSKTARRVHALADSAHYTLKQVMQRNTGIRWAIENGLFTFQVDSIWDLIEATESWSLEGVAHLITCPTLVCEAEGDHFFAG
jgi:hypothetical protein